jgi:uncharacterized protein
MADTTDITVKVLEQGARAQVRIPAGFDTANLTTPLVLMFATQAGVQVTAQVEKLAAAAVESFKAAPTTDLVTDIAHAIAPVTGAPGGWTWEPQFDPAAKPAGGETPSSAQPSQGTDHYSSHIVAVTAGVIVAKIKPPTDGADGRAVTGAVIAAKPGNPAEVRAGAGLTVRSDNTVVAAIDGVLTIVRGTATVSAALEVKGSVDFSTGHIDFKGDVTVADAIRDGFQVKATGTVTVHGPVEGATIACQGNLSCPRGIASARRAQVTVDGNADLGYLRNAQALFHGDLTCAAEIEHSEVTVGGALNCESGRVSGGSLALTGAAIIGTLGSPDWVPTTVRLGDLPLVAMELKKLTAEALRTQRAMAAKEEHIRTITAYGGKSAASREELCIVQYELSELQQAAAQIEARRGPLQAAMRQGRKAGVYVTGIVYPRVRIQHANHAFEFEQELKGPLQFVLDENGSMFIRISTLEPQPLSDFAKTVILQNPQAELAAPTLPESARKSA